MMFPLLGMINLIGVYMSVVYVDVHDFYNPGVQPVMVEPPVVKVSLDRQTLITWSGFALARVISILEILNLRSVSAPRTFDPVIGLDAAQRSAVMVDCCMKAFREKPSLGALIRKAGEAFRADKESRLTPEVSQRPEMRPVGRNARLVVRSINDVDAMSCIEVPAF